MTPLQHKRYLRFWSAAWKAHWSGVRGGEPLARPDRPLSAFRDEIVQVASQLAAADQGRLTPDHLRYACHFVAIGSTPSSRDLDNKQQDLVIAVFQRLAEDGNELVGQMRIDQREAELHRRYHGGTEARSCDGLKIPWDATRPDADRKRVIFAIEHSGYPLAAVEKIAGSIFHTANWKSLPTSTLQKLLMTVKSRARAKRDREAVPSP
jgi:hypothetical protein